MTVKELIAELTQYDPDLPVAVYETKMEVLPVRQVELKKLVAVPFEIDDECWLDDPRTQNVLLIKY